MSAMKLPSAPMVKLKPHTHASLLEISKQDDRPMGEIVAELVDRYEKERFWLQVRADLAALKRDPAAWQEYRDEQEFWNTIAGDGLDREEPYYTPEEEREILAKAAVRTERG